MRPLDVGNPDADAWRIVVIIVTLTALAVRPDVALGEIPGMYWVCGLLLAGWLYCELRGPDDLDAPAGDDLDDF